VRVHLGTGVTDGAEPGRQAVLEVADSGIGIEADHLPRIFDRFYRVDKSRSRSQGGSGLGLAICRWIAEGHGGQIEVASRPGLGSTFTVRLPLEAGPPTGSPGAELAEVGE